MTRYCYSKLKNTWSSEDRKHTYSYTDPPPTSSKGLVVFDIDDTLRVVDLEQDADCLWRTSCKFPNTNNTLADTQNRAVEAINKFYGMGYDIAIYTREGTSEVTKGGPGSALAYVTGLASKLSHDNFHDNRTKFTKDILDNYQNNIMFGTSTKYGGDKGPGLVKLAGKLNIPLSKVLMFDDSNDNIRSIRSSGICGITVSNTPYTCGISEKNLSDGVDFFTSGQCPPIIKNPSVGPGTKCPTICTSEQSCADGSCKCAVGSRCGDYGTCCSQDCTNVFCDQRNECGETCGCGEGQYCDGWRRCLPCKIDKDCAFLGKTCNKATGECLDNSFSNFNY
jgi:hypothetical protein